MTFTELCDKLGIEYRSGGHEHCRDGWVQIDCPACSPNWQHFRLGYNIRGGYMNCWGCGPKRTSNVLSEITGLHWKELKPYLEALSRNFSPIDVKVRGKLVLPTGTFIPLLKSKPHRAYLEERGFDPREIERLWGVQALRWDSNHPWRLFLPIQFRGETVSWTTRALTQNHTARYISASLEEEKIHHKDLLYGEDYLRNTIIVCEGPTDVWRIGPGAVCTFGTGFKTSQIARISRYPVRVVCFDSDDSGLRQAQKLGEALRETAGETVIVKLKAKDPGSATKKEIRELRETFLN